MILFSQFYHNCRNTAITRMAKTLKLYTDLQYSANSM